jgi:hypothetical protein
MMLVASHAQLIRAAESFARETFTSVFPSGADWTSQVARLQSEFRAIIGVEACRYTTLRFDLNDWRKRVIGGSVEFDPAQEDEFKEAIGALIGFEDFLIETFDTYAFGGRGLFLVKPRLVNLVQAHRQAAQSILDSWKSPEWEAADERTVKWNEEQTEYLRRRLASCE